MFRCLLLSFHALIWARSAKGFQVITKSNSILKGQKIPWIGADDCTSGMLYGQFPAAKNVVLRIPVTEGCPDAVSSIICEGQFGFGLCLL